MSRFSIMQVTETSAILIVDNLPVGVLVHERTTMRMQSSSDEEPRTWPYVSCYTKPLDVHVQTDEEYGHLWAPRLCGGSLASSTQVTVAIPRERADRPEGLVQAVALELTKEA